MRDGRLATAGGHAKGSKKIRHQYLELSLVFAFFFDELENDSVSLSHTSRMRRFDVVFDDTLPATSIQPASAQALHFFDVFHFGRLFVRDCFRTKQVVLFFVPFKLLNS